MLLEIRSWGSAPLAPSSGHNYQGEGQGQSALSGKSWGQGRAGMLQHTEMRGRAGYFSSKGSPGVSPSLGKTGCWERRGRGGGTVPAQGPLGDRSPLASSPTLFPSGELRSLTQGATGREGGPGSLRKERPAERENLRIRAVPLCKVLVIAPLAFSRPLTDELWRQASAEGAPSPANPQGLALFFTG